MHSRYWVITGVWLAYGVLNAMLVHYRGILFGKPMPWHECLLYEVSFALLWAAITPAILELSKRFPVGTPRNFLIHAVAAIIASAVTKSAWDYTTLPFLEPSMVPSNFFEAGRSVLRTLDFGVLHYIIVIVCCYAWDYRQRYEDGRLRASQLEARLATAQLQALKMQLHPHFLFNTLHSISELVHDDPKRAESMIMRLSDFLRMTLDQVGQPEVSLENELDFLGHYLEIEQMRFEERLRVEWVVEKEALTARVPNLILQPMVENALKHGIARITSQGVLRIGCTRQGEKLRMSVRDNGPGQQAETRGREGVGLTNTRRRLEKLYGGNHHIELKGAPGGGFEVVMTIPFREV